MFKIHTYDHQHISGNLETDINKIIVRSWIMAYADDSKKVNELVSIGQDNGIEKQYIKGT